MNTKENIIVEGEVTENLPNTQFRVLVDKTATAVGGTVILCYLSGRMRRNYIRILPGDRVRVEITPYDLKRGRIIYRLS